MARYLLIFCSLLLLAVNAEACTMAFPAFGVYSGGKVVFWSFFSESFFLILAGAVLLKSAIYGVIARGNFQRLFGGMLVANIVTTGVGYLMELLHIAFIVIFISVPVAFLIFRYAAKTLHPTGMIKWLEGRSSNRTAIRLTLLFWVAAYLAALQADYQYFDPVFWVAKYAYAWLALLLTLVATTGFELGILNWMRKKQDGGEPVDWEPVVKANLFIFLLLFVSETAVLYHQGMLFNWKGQI